MTYRRRIELAQKALAGLLAILMLLPSSLLAQGAGSAPPVAYPAQPGVTLKALDGQAPPTSFQQIPQAPALPPQGTEVKGEEKGEKLPADAQKKAAPEPKVSMPTAPESPFARLLAQEASGIVGDVSIAIQPFGYNLFQAPTVGIPPGTQTPVSLDYILGPDDEFTVTIWGMVDGVYKVRVNREGVVVFPRVGEVPVAGVRYGELREHMERAFSRHLRNFQLSVTMGQLRAIQVFVVGEVTNPGNYTLSSLSTVLSALFAVGGPTTNGTLRDIRVLRNGKVAAQVDLYEFLLKGDKSQDLRLQDQDTVFVPLVGPIVGVTGDVRRPAIYEVLGKATLGDVLDLAGGLTSTGYLTRVQIERVVAHEKRITVDLNLERSAGPQDSERAGLRAPIQNMDMVKVFPISPVMQGVVYLKGHVVRPGSYEFKPGMKVMDVLKTPADLLPEAFPDYARIVRYTEPDRAKRVVPFNLQKALSGDPAANLELQSQDQITVYSKEEFRVFPSVSIVGEVRKSGTFPLLKEMRVSDLVVLAGGLQKLAYSKQAELTRYVVAEGKTNTTVLLIDMDRAFAGDPNHNLELQELDSLAVRPIPDSDVGRAVTVQGEVKLSGIYTVKRGERLSSVLKRAGGFSAKAFPRGLLLIRESVKRAQQSESQKFIALQRQRLSVEAAALSAGNVSPQGAPAGGMTPEQATLQLQVQALEQMSVALANGRVVVKVSALEQLEGTADDILLEPGDQITVPQQPSTVTILGAVRNPLTVLHRRGFDLDDYIGQAGGLTDEALKSDLYIVRADGSTEADYVRLKEIEPGDTVVVPARIEPKSRPVQLWTAIASILGSLILGTAAIAVIGR